MRRPRMRKAAARMDQPKDVWTTRRWTIMGKMTPPSEEPEAIIP